jgi:flagellar operon protein (TIGR03826 family)
MNEVTDCPRCGDLYVKNAFREICPKCSRAEEDLYQKTFTFLRKRENRAATMERVVEVTGASEEMIQQWVRKGRLQAAQFPNLGYPCDRCGAIIQKGKLCSKCITEIESDLKLHDSEQEFSRAKQDKQDSHQRTFHMKKD